MKIRTRLTLWYAAILIASLAAIGFQSYQEIAEAMQHGHRHFSWEHALGETGEIILYVGLPAVILGVLGGWWLTRKALAPVTALTEAVEKIHDRNLSEQLPRTRNGDELDRLTEVFNAMTARLDGSFQRIREFTLHASHELKTPLTVMRGELETSLHEENLTPAQTERLLSQIDEMDDLVRESFAYTRILAQSHNIHVNLVVCDEVSISGDRHRLRQLLLNLSDNAVKYNRPDGAVTVSLQRNDGSAELKITNTGAGIAPEVQPRVFERFFRGDLSHNNVIEGCGLGLSIAQWIALAHKGSIQFVSEPDKLTTVTVKFPAADANSREASK
jgi:signal transduction histidine kinase